MPLSRDDLNDLAEYRVEISKKLEDPEWDEFLQEIMKRHHVQSSLWAQLKKSVGWDCVRLVIHQNEIIVAGVQILTKRVPALGKIGYITRGPVTSKQNRGLIKLLIYQLTMLLKQEKIQYLVVQPPLEGEIFIQDLRNKGFRPTEIAITAVASVWVDLLPELDQILATMRSSTRRNIRKGKKAGIIVRQGNELDLDTFYELLQLTGVRSGFPTLSYQYFTEMWKIFNPSGQIKLFLAEFHNELISGSLVLAFGDTVSSKYIAWNGEHGTFRPNDALHWSIIHWARSNGYRFYDLEGIEPEVAKLTMDGKPLPKSELSSVSRFKLGYSKQIALLPGAYDRLTNPFLRWPYQLAYPLIERSNILGKIMNRFRISSG